MLQRLLPKIAKNGAKQHKSSFFAQKGKKASDKGRRPPQELEVGPHSGPYLLVIINCDLFRMELDGVGCVDYRPSTTSFLALMVWE